MKNTIFFLILFSVSFLFSQDFSKTRYVKEKVNLRGGRGTDFRIKKVLQPNDEFKTGMLKDNWYSVFDADCTNFEIENIVGYIYKPLVFAKPEIVNSGITLDFIQRNMNSVFTDYDMLYDENDKPVHYASSSDNGMMLKIFGGTNEISKITLDLYIFKDDPDTILGFRFLTANRFVNSFVPKANRKERWVEQQFQNALKGITEERVEYKNSEIFEQITVIFEYNEALGKCEITVIY